MHMDCSKRILKTRRKAVPTTGQNAGAIETPLREVGEQMSRSVLGARIPGRNVPAARITPPAAMNS